jgi:Fe-S-cluster containining protein
MGHCCESFVISNGAGAIKDTAHLERLRADYASGDLPDTADKTHLAEVEFILDMLVLLGHDADGDAQFTCRHYNADDRECMVYEDRPGMCREYGVTTPCTNPKCAWRHAKRQLQLTGPVAAGAS